jgi:excisionase family DNA binding protein
VKTKTMNRNLLDSLPELLTVADVAKLLNVSKITVYRWLENEELEFLQVKYKGVKRVPKESLIKFFNENLHKV